VAFLSADRGHPYANTIYNPAWVQWLQAEESATSMPRREGELTWTR
jgi:hypothetical protein